MPNKVFRFPASKSLRALAVVATVVGVGAAGVAMKPVLFSSTALATQPLQAVQAVPVPALPVNIADVVEKVTPAVVTIKTSSSQQGRGQGPAGAREAVPPQFREFFQRFFGPDAPWQFDDRSGRQQSIPAPHPHARGLGSGFVIEKDGLIVTNNHVIDGADTITVELNDGREVAAKVVGTDDKTDLALLKVDAGKDLPTIKFGNSDRMRVGDWVIAVGNPFGVGKTATVGIISARHRDIGAGPFDDFLQIDAPINQGNSGGPALNLNGEVVGINAAIFTPSGGNVGIGFAIPSTMAREVIADLKDDGKIDRGWLGVHIQGLTPAIADSLNLKKPEGALVAKVNEDSPAAKGGLRQGDVILAVDGKDVTRLRDLPRYIASLNAGDKAEIVVWRDGKKQSLKVTIGEAPAKPQLLASAEPDTVNGLGLASLDQSSRRNFDIGADVSGVVITEVDPRSPAAQQGLHPGDVILAVGGKSVSTPSEVKGAFQRAQSHKARAVLLLVQRQSVERFVALPLRDA